MPLIFLYFSSLVITSTYSKLVNLYPINTEKVKIKIKIILCEEEVSGLPVAIGSQDHSKHILGSRFNNWDGLAGIAVVSKKDFGKNYACFNPSSILKDE